MERGAILLVEDNAGDVILVREALKEHGLFGELIVVTDGESAIEYISRLDADPTLLVPALAILDINLPRKNGRDVLRHMRACARCASLPVAFLSSSDAAVDRQAAKELGAVAYIRKPSNLDDFMMIGATIKALLRACL